MNMLATMKDWTPSDWVIFFGALGTLFVVALIPAIGAWFKGAAALALAKKNEQTNAAFARTLPTTPEPQPQDAEIIQAAAATPPTETK